MKYLLLLIMTTCIFSQAEFIHGKGWDVTIVMGDFTNEEKKDTITYLKSKADKMELSYNNKHITAYEIVSIGTDSIEVELLNEWGYPTQISRMPTAKPPDPASYKRKIAIKDIHTIHYQEIPLIPKFIKYTLVGALVIKLLFYFILT